MCSLVHITANSPPSKFFSEDTTKLAKVAEKAEIAWSNCIVDDVRKDAEAVAAVFKFNINLVKKALEGRYSSFVDNETQVALMLPSIQVKSGQIKIHPVIVLIRPGLILTVQDKDITRFANFARYAETHLRKMHAVWDRTDRLTWILLRLIDENNERNYTGIKTLAGQIDKLGKLLADQDLGFAKIADATYDLKHNVTFFLSALWENYHTLRILNHGDIQMLSGRPEILDRFTQLIDENAWYIQLGENLTLILGSGAEAMQDYHNIHLVKFNNILTFVTTWLGVLGTMFLVPNTIATAMASSTFQLGTGDAWWYALMLLTATLVSCGTVYYLVQRFWKLTMAMALQKARMTTSVKWTENNGGTLSKLVRRNFTIPEK
jgi:Mg2+ and Co2+ transporter CorA